MNKSTYQNGVSSPPVYGQRHERSTPNASTNSGAPHGGSFSHPSKHSSITGPSHKMRENELFQNREVLLKLLQPPAMHIPGRGCSTPFQEKGKTCFKSDVCGTHCSRCFQPPHNPVVLSREAEDWRPKTLNGNCDHPQIREEQQKISNMETGENHVQPHRDLESRLNLPCHKEELSRTSRTKVLFPRTVHSPSCEARTRPFHPEELHLQASRCQQLHGEFQPHLNGSHCFCKETFPNDRNSSLLRKRKQTDENRAENLNGESLKKNVSNCKPVYPPNWCYHEYETRTFQPPALNQTSKRDQPDMETLSPDVGRVNDKVRHFEERYHLAPPSNIQDKTSDPSSLAPESYGGVPSRPSVCAPFGPSEESLRDQYPEEKKKRLEKASGEHSQALPHSPNESSQVIESQMDECTPVIVHCYSLSEHGSSSDSQSMNIHKGNTKFSIGKEASWIPDRHSDCSDQRPPPKRHKSSSELQDEEDVLDGPSTPRPGSKTNEKSHSFNTTSKRVTNDASTTFISVDDNQKQNDRTSVLQNHVHEKYRPLPNCHSSNCQPGPCANVYGRNYIQTRLSPYSCSKQCLECVSNPEIIHTPNGHQSVHTARDGHSGDNSRPEPLRIWPNKQIPYNRRPALKIHDYYEERRVLVGNFRQDSPGSVEGAESEKGSNNSCNHTRELYSEDHRLRYTGSAELFQIPACNDGPFEIRVHQQDAAVGSKKRKSRLPRPQKVKLDDLGQTSVSEDDYPVQFDVDHLQDPLNNRYHHHAHPSCVKYASMPGVASRETREDAKVHGEDCEMHSHEEAQTSVSVHYDSVRRCEDNVSENISSRSLIHTRDIPQDALQPWHTLSKGRRAIVSSEPFFARGSLHDDPSFEVDGTGYRPTNCLSFEYQSSSHCQSETPKRVFEKAHRNTAKRPKNLSAERNAAQQHWHRPAYLSGQENQFGTLENRVPVYDSNHGNWPSGTRMPPCMPREGSLMFQVKRNSESLWAALSKPGYAERQQDNFDCHDVLAKDKSPSKNSNTIPTSLSSDHRGVSRTFSEDNSDLEKTQISQRPLQSDQACTSTEDNNSSNRMNTEQNLNTSVNPNFYFEVREVYTDYLAPEEKEKKFVCRYCSKKFAHFSTLQNHLRTHTGDKPFQCKFCSRRFAQSGVLKAHLRTHTGDKPFACMYCGKMFAQSTTLTNHLRTHTGQKPYICNFCGKSFSQPSTLRKHQLSHTKERPYSCKFCEKAFAQQSTLTNHLRSHTGQRPYKCHFCEKSFAQLSTLDRHLRLHSTVSLKPHKCQYCNKSFSYFSNLVSHMQVHQKEETICE